jgi:predicted negative regulator of RcsB-dependent stress response
MCLEQLIRVGSALLTPLILIVATYIAWQQWKTNRQKLVMDHYERRLRVYEEVQRILRTICTDLKPSIEDLLKQGSADVFFTSAACPR